MCFHLEKVLPDAPGIVDHLGCTRKNLIEVALANGVAADQITLLDRGGVIAPDERLPWLQTAVMCIQHVIAMFGATVLAPILMGFDPGLGTTGWGVIAADGNRLSHVANGQIRTDKEASMASRLLELDTTIARVIEIYKPDFGVVEEIFVNVNPQSTLLLGQARGAAIAGLLSLEGSPHVNEYTALQMKKAVAGHGHATKAQIRHMVMRLLDLPREPNNDASDALGLAICHAHAGSLMAQVAKKTDLNRRTHAQIKGGRVY